MASQQLKLKDDFFKNIVPALKKELKMENVWSVPRLTKVNINVGLGSFLANKKDYSEVIDNLAALAGQKPVVTLSRKAISNFKIKENQPIGVTVTLRGKRMYDFVSRLVNVTLPRIRDFRGISPKGFDGNGNFTLGVTENTVFPEINPDNIDNIHGLEVTLVTTAKDNKSGRKLLEALGFRFQKIKEKEAKK